MSCRTKEDTPVLRLNATEAAGVICAPLIQ